MHSICSFYSPVALLIHTKYMFVYVYGLCPVNKVSPDNYCSCQGEEPSYLISVVLLLHHVVRFLYFEFWCVFHNFEVRFVLYNSNGIFKDALHLSSTSGKGGPFSVAKILFEKIVLPIHLYQYVCV